MKNALTRRFEGALDVVRMRNRHAARGAGFGFGILYGVLVCLRAGIAAVDLIASAELRTRDGFPREVAPAFRTRSRLRISGHLDIENGDGSALGAGNAHHARRRAFATQRIA